MADFSSTLSNARHWVQDHAKLVGGLALVAFVAVGAFFWSSDQTVSEAVTTERENLRRLKVAANGRWGGTGYAELTTASAIADRVVPSSMLQGRAGQIRSVWGTPVELKPHRVAHEGDGFSVVYRGIPQRDCVAMARVMGASLYDLHVSGQSVMGAAGPEMAEVQQRCNDQRGATVEFIFNDRFIPGTALPRG